MWQILVRISGVITWDEHPLSEHEEEQFEKDLGVDDFHDLKKEAVDIEQGFLLVLALSQGLEHQVADHENQQLNNVCCVTRSRCICL